ncbi:MAG: hypothetical protein HN703_05310 [Planctomycetaceae bacterium]|nr:hypothetical protein [Planctomycetaceae bacterium]
MIRLFGRSRTKRPSTSIAADKISSQQSNRVAHTNASEVLSPLYRHLVSFVPTRPAALFAVAAIQICVTSLAVIPCLGREFTAYDFLPDGGEYSQSVDILRGGIGLQGQAHLAGWFTHISLLLATGVTLILRSIHRNRRDATRPGFRPWGALAALWILASLATTVPIGPAVALAMREVTETSFGPQGLGWWVTLGSLYLFITISGTLFRLQEKLPPVLTATSGLLFWCASTVCIWFSATDPRLLLLSNASWLIGSEFMLFTMLLAVRGSLREIDGLCKPKKPALPKKKHRSISSPAIYSSTEKPDNSASTAIDFEEVPMNAADEQHSETNEDLIDEETYSSDNEPPLQRRLSKAQRRRLRKLTRNGRAA